MSDDYKIPDAPDKDYEVKMMILEFAKDAKTMPDISKKVKAYLKENDELPRLGEYVTAIQRLKDRKEILQ